MMTWDRFRDRSVGNEFYFFNTHFDHESQLARENSAKLVRELIAALGSPLPVLLAGDSNAAAGANQAYAILTQDAFFSDTWDLASTGLGEVRVASAEIVTLKPEDRWASDHFPVAAVVRLGGG